MNKKQLDIIVELIDQFKIDVKECKEEMKQLSQAMNKCLGTLDKIN
jgi:pyruvate-formate lyase-activating enzyme